MGLPEIHDKSATNKHFVADFDSFATAKPACYRKQLVTPDYGATQGSPQISILWLILVHLQQQSPPQMANVLVVVSKKYRGRCDIYVWQASIFFCSSNHVIWGTKCCTLSRHKCRTQKRVVRIRYRCSISNLNNKIQFWSVKISSNREMQIMFKMYRQY